MREDSSSVKPQLVRFLTAIKDVMCGGFSEQVWSVGWKFCSHNLSLLKQKKKTLFKLNLPSWPILTNIYNSKTDIQQRGVAHSGAGSTPLVVILELLTQMEVVSAVHGHYQLLMGMHASRYGTAIFFFHAVQASVADFHLFLGQQTIHCSVCSFIRISAGQVLAILYLGTFQSNIA